MLELSQQEWAIIFVAGIIIFGWLLLRSKAKKTRDESAPLLAAMLHRKSVLAQMEALDGATNINSPTHSGSPFGMGRYLEDGYVRAAIGMESNRQDFFRQALDAESPRFIL